MTLRFCGGFEASIYRGKVSRVKKLITPFVSIIGPVLTIYKATYRDPVSLHFLGSHVSTTKRSKSAAPDWVKRPITEALRLIPQGEVWMIFFLENCGFIQTT